MRLYLICKGPPDEYGQFGAVQHGASVSPSYHSLSTRAHSTRIVFGTWSCSVVGGGLTPPTPEEPATAEAAADAGYGVAPSCGESEISIIGGLFLFFLHRTFGGLTAFGSCVS